MNYICKQDGGLEINPVSSKATALFIKNIIEEAGAYKKITQKALP